MVGRLGESTEFATSLFRGVNLQGGRGSVDRWVPGQKWEPLCRVPKASYRPMTDRPLRDDGKVLREASWAAEVFRDYC